MHTAPRENERAPILSNDFTSQWAEIQNDVLTAVANVGKSGWYILGKEVHQFESRFAVLTGSTYAIGCASGLDAIEISLRALGIRRGEKVLTTPLSAFATTLGIFRAGGTPVFIDVDRSGLIDLKLVESILENDPSIRFLVPVHLYGHTLNLSWLSTIKDKFSIRIVEDCAQAVGAGFDDMGVGTVGDISAFSFYPTKNLGTMGDAGAMVTQSEVLAGACRMLRDYGQAEKFDHRVIGLNSRIDEIQAAILNHALLPRLDSWTIQRKNIAKYYLDNIQNALITPLPAPEYSRSVWHLFPVMVANGERSRFLDDIKTQDIQAAVHYPTLINNQPALTDYPFHVAGKLDNAESIARAEVSLPIHPYLSTDDVTRVVEFVNKWR